MSINPTVRRNHTEQGTAVDLEKGWKLSPNGTNLFKDFSDTDPEKTRDFKSMIHCCDKLPYMDQTGGITSRDTNGEKFPILPECEDRYEYLHACGCPQVFIWEYNRGGSLINAYKEADGQSNENANGTPDEHPEIPNGTPPATDSMFGANGAVGFYSLGAQDAEETATHFGKYALRCDNLHKGCNYVVYVIFTMQNDDINGGSLFHGGAESIPFTADNCVHYIGGDKDGNHVDGTNTELKKFPSAEGSADNDGYVNIKSLHIQMAGIPQGRSQSSLSHAENPSKC